MKRTKLAADSHAFVACVDEVRNSNAVDRFARRRLQTARRQLVRTLIRFFQTVSDDELSTLAGYALLLTA